MLRIEVNNINIDLPQNASMEITMESPFLDYEKMQGSFGFTVNVPGSKRNKVAYNFPDHIDTKDYTHFKLQPAKIYDNDIFLFNALTKLNKVKGSLKASTGTYIASFGFDMGYFGDKTLDKSLTEYDYGQLSSIYGSGYNTWWETIRNQFNVSDSSQVDFAGYPFYCYQSPLNGQQGSFYNLCHFTGENNYPGGDHSFQPYLIFILRTIFSAHGYSLQNESILADRDFLQLTLLLTHKFLTNPATISEHLPNVKSRDLINSVRQLCNCGIFPSRKNSTVRIVTYNDIVNSGELVDLTAKVSLDFEMDPFSNEGYNFVQEVDGGDRVTHNPDFDTKKFLKVGEVNTFSALGAATTLPTQYHIVHNEVALYSEEIPRQRIGWNYTRYNTGNGEREINVKASATAMIPFNVNVHPSWPPNNNYTPPQFLMPWVVPEALSNQTAIRLAFYRGLHQASDGQYYPLGTSGMHTFNGTSCGSWHLGWQGANGLYDTFWKTMIAHRTRWPFTISFNVMLDHNDLAKIDFTKRYQIDTAEYIIASITLKLPLKTSCKITFWRIK